MEQKDVLTIKDVAVAAGVSASTVSRYLANPESVRAYAAYNIRNAIRELNYEPNATAQSLRRGFSNTIGVVTPSSHYFFGDSYKAISDYFYTKGYITYLCSSDNDADKERFFIQGMLNQKVAGLAVVSSGKNVEYLLKVSQERKRMMVMLDRPEQVGCDIVAENHEENAYILVRHYMSKLVPRRPVAMLFGIKESISTQKVLAGVNRALEEDGILPEECRPFFGCNKPEVMKEAIEYVRCNLDEHCKPGIIAFGPDFLEEAAFVLNRLGLSAKDNVELAGFAMPNSIDKLGFDFPCIIQNPEYSGIVAAQALYKRICGDIADSEPHIYTIEVKQHLL